MEGRFQFLIKRNYLSAFVQKEAQNQINLKRGEPPNSQVILMGKPGRANLMTTAGTDMGLTYSNSEVSVGVPK